PHARAVPARTASRGRRPSDPRRAGATGSRWWTARPLAPNPRPLRRRVQQLKGSNRMAFIDGTDTAGSGTRRELGDPATGLVIEEIADCSRAELDRVVAAGRAAFPGRRESTARA